MPPKTLRSNTSALVPAGRRLDGTNVNPLTAGSSPVVSVVSADSRGSAGKSALRTYAKSVGLHTTVSAS